MSFDPPANAVHDDPTVDSRLHRLEPTNRLESFPPGATLALALATPPEQSVHVGEHIQGKGVTVIVAMRDLIEDVDGLKPVTKGSFVGRIRALVLTARPISVGEYFRNSLTWAHQVGGAREIHVPSHELAVLLGIEGRSRSLRNAYLVVRDGVIVWSSISEADKRHSAAGLAEAIEHALSASA